MDVLKKFFSKKPTITPRETLLLLCETDEQLIFLETLMDNVKSGKRVTRSEAMDIFKKNDNSMRIEITRMRSNGIPILSDAEAGYFFPRNMTDLTRFATLYLAPANTRYQNYNRMRDVAFNYFNEQEEI